MPDPSDPPPLHRKKRKDENGWNWPGWLIAYIVTLVVIRDIILTLLQ